ncbi:MAG: hypothetical protein LUC93_16330 [Planctomycetaceae bacterium]|nr:hypothetical protein [Planctomycetaceae bacterium]
MPSTLEACVITSSRLFGRSDSRTRLGSREPSGSQRIQVTSTTPFFSKRASGRATALCSTDVEMT